jgi:cellobiose-specific phosphotransferase system component IIC
MKTLPLTLLSAAASLTFAFAQTAAVTTGVQTYTGDVVGISPASSTITVSSGANVAPVAYTYTKETKFVDANGNVVSASVVHDNTPVQVEYSVDNGVRRVDRVMVQPAATTTTEETTTTTTKDED